MRHVSTILAAVALSASACVMSSTHEQAVASLRDEMSKQRQSADETLAAAQKRCADEAAAAAAASKAAADEASAKAADELGKCRREVEACVAAGGDKGKALAECQKERDLAKDRLARVQSSIDKVKQALAAMQAAGKLEVKERNGFLIIALAGDILFDTGKAKLKDEAAGVLRELAGVLKAMGDRNFQVAGHTDDQGEEEKNWGLSTDRAVTVVRFLIKEGVAGKALSAGGYAFFQPVADNGTPEGRAKNRRVEFLLMPNLSELLKMGK